MKIKLKQELIKDPNIIPESPGVYWFHGEKEVLFLAKTSNLKRSIGKFLNSKPDTEQTMKLISLCHRVAWQEEESLLASLITEKLELDKNIPQFNQLLKPGAGSVYLKISFNKVPYFSIAENTLGNEYYVGPFFDRFFPLDVIDIFNRLKKYPACENEDYPCYRYKNGNCTGWCLKDAAERSEMIMNNYLAANETLLQTLQNKQKELFDQLEFEQENILKEQMLILEKYYEFIRFFHSIKNLDLEVSFKEYELRIRNGQIEKITHNDQEFHFPISKPEYRKNEYLAIEKEQLSESWILFNYFKKKYSQKSNDLYLASALNLRKEMGLKSGS